MNSIHQPRSSLANVTVNVTSSLLPPSLPRGPPSRGPLNLCMLGGRQQEVSQYCETCIKRTPSIKRTVVEVPKFISLIYL